MLRRRRREPLESPPRSCCHVRTLRESKQRTRVVRLTQLDRLPWQPLLSLLKRLPKVRPGCGGKLGERLAVSIDLEQIVEACERKG